MEDKKTLVRCIRQSPKLPADQRRQQLLKAAQALFEKQGYRATTLDQIAARAGLTKGSVYHHFESKEDMAAALSQTIFRLYLDALETVPIESMGPGDLLRHLRCLDRELPPGKLRYNRTLMAEAFKIPRMKDLIDQGHSKYIEMCVDRISRKYGRTRSARKQLVILTLSFYDGLNWANIVYPHHVDFDKQVKLFSDMCDTNLRTEK